jgi:hypothetical protein
MKNSKNPPELSQQLKKLIKIKIYDRLLQVQENDQVSSKVKDMVNFIGILSPGTKAQIKNFLLEDRIFKERRRKHANQKNQEKTLPQKAP